MPDDETTRLDERLRQAVLALAVVAAHARVCEVRNRLRQLHHHPNGLMIDAVVATLSEIASDLEQAHKVACDAA